MDNASNHGTSGLNGHCSEIIGCAMDSEPESLTSDVDGYKTSSESTPLNLTFCRRNPKGISITLVKKRSLELKMR